MTKQVPLMSASATQLADFAVKNLGLEITPKMSADAIRAKIATTGYAKDFIDIDEPEPASAPSSAAAAPVEKRKTVRIIIPHQEGPGGKEHVPVGVNGRVYRIMRGTPVDVPAEVVEVLEHAQKIVYERGTSGEPINPRLVPEYPFSVLAAA